METPLIEFRNVTKQFNSYTVLDGIDLTIYENQVSTITAKSGGGKSVLLKHIIGLMKPDSGDILFHGKSLRDMKKKEWEDYRSIMGYMFQGNALFDSMNVFDNIAFPLVQTTNLSRKDIKQRVMTRIEEMELAEAWNKYPSELSGGMQKRVALARTLVTDPKIVLFDEPTTGQDPVRKNVILSMIAHARKKFGFTAILISHEVPDVFFISDRILILWEGKIAFQGTYEEMTGLRGPVVDEFLRSLEGFQDELTGLLSKEMFRARYGAELSVGRKKSKLSAILFSVDFDLLEKGMGHEASLYTLKALAEYTNRYFSPMGGFSARHSRGEILTILPHAELAEAQQLLKSFGKGLHENVLEKIRDVTKHYIGMGCFGISVNAGLTEASATDEIDEMIENARKKQQIVAAVLCDDDNGGKMK
jgi:phospholipid/cholesterol/gamma-HCH transport system ATP-binding protein